MGCFGKRQKKWLDIITKIKNKSQAQINHHRRRPTKPFCMNGISMVFKRMIMIYILNSSRKKLSNNRETKKKSLTLEIAARNGNKNAINYTPIKITSCHIHNRCEIHLPPILRHWLASDSPISLSLVHLQFQIDWTLMPYLRARITSVLSVIMQ